MRALPGALATVDALADDHRVGLVTNGPPALQRPKLAAAGVTDRFDTVVFAGFDAAAKPDPAPDFACPDIGAVGAAPWR